VRETEAEAEVIPNLMIGFGIDKIQAEYVVEIRLRNLNKEYIIKRTQEIDVLSSEIKELEDTLKNESKIKNIIIKELSEVRAKYAKPRKSEIMYEHLQTEESIEEDDMPDYAVNVFFTKEAYFKKITPASLRMSGEQKLKENDEILTKVESHNTAEVLFFTNQNKVYKARLGDFDDSKASVIGEYLPAKLGMDDGELPIFMKITDDYKGFMLFVFAGGRIAKVPLESYYTKQNRKKLINAYSDKDEIFKILSFTEEAEIAMQTTAGRLLLVNTAQIAQKVTKNTAGVMVINLKKGQKISDVKLFSEMALKDEHRFRVRSLPAAGAALRADDIAEQIVLE
jgi:DNA gyrase subunit A